MSSCYSEAKKPRKSSWLIETLIIKTNSRNFKLLMKIVAFVFLFSDSLAISLKIEKFSKIFWGWKKFKNPRDSLLATSVHRILDFFPVSRLWTWVRKLNDSGRWWIDVSINIDVLPFHEPLDHLRRAIFLFFFFSFATTHLIRVRCGTRSSHCEFELVPLVENAFTADTFNYIFIEACASMCTYKNL